MSFRTVIGILLAFLAAPLAPALVALPFSVAMDLSTGSALQAGSLLFPIIVFLVAAVHTGVFGVPLFMIGYLKRRLTRENCVLFGFLAGALPLMVLEFVVGAAQNEPLPAIVGPALIFGFAGAMGGFAFGTVLRALNLLPALNSRPVPG